MRGFKAEPVMIVAGIRALIYAASVFGLFVWSDLQVEAFIAVVLLVVVPIVEALSGWFLRTQVTTEDTLNQAGTNTIDTAAVAKSPYLRFKAHLVLPSEEQK